MRMQSSCYLRCSANACSSAFEPYESNQCENGMNVKFVNVTQPRLRFNVHSEAPSHLFIECNSMPLVRQPNAISLETVNLNRVGFKRTDISISSDFVLWYFQMDFGKVIRFASLKRIQIVCFLRWMDAIAWKWFAYMYFHENRQFTCEDGEKQVQQVPNRSQNQFLNLILPCPLINSVRSKWQNSCEQRHYFIYYCCVRTTNFVHNFDFIFFVLSSEKVVAQNSRW